MVIQVIFYAFIFWLGIYLNTRDLYSACLRWAGLGLVSNAFPIALDLLASLGAGTTAEKLLPAAFLAHCGPGTFVREKKRLK